MSIRIKTLLIVICLLLPQPVLSQEGYNFIHYCITAFSTLHKITIEYESALENPINITKAEEAITKFNSEILIPMNFFDKSSKSSNPKIKKTSKDIQYQLSKFVKNNNKMLLILKNEKLDSIGLNENCNALLQGNRFGAMYFIDIFIAVCSSVVGVRDKVGPPEFYLKLTREERDLLNKLLIDSYGEKSIVRINTVKGKTSYEEGSRYIYSFLNSLKLEWVFLK